MNQRAVLILLAPLCLFGVLVALVKLAWNIALSPGHGWRQAVSFDELANAALNGNPDETISSRAARAKLLNRRWGCVLCRMIDALDPGHCDRNLEKRFLGL